MAVIDTFSKRKAQQEGKGIPLQATQLPEKFRTQVMHLLVAALGSWVENLTGYLAYRGHLGNTLWESVHKRLLVELGKFSLAGARSRFEDCYRFLMSGDTDEVLDLIELALQHVKFADQMQLNTGQNDDRTLTPSGAIADFNIR